MACPNSRAWLALRAVDVDDVRADVGIFGDVAVVAIADFDLERFGARRSMSCRTCGFAPSTSATTFNSLWKGIGIVGFLAAKSACLRRRLRCYFTHSTWKTPSISSVPSTSLAKPGNMWPHSCSVRR